MVVRHRKRGRRKFMGSRSWGAGNTKNRRGKGCRGGSGNSGPSKARKTYFMANDKGHLGAHGFVRPGPKVRLCTIDLTAIQRMADKGDLKKSGDRYEFVFDGKVLGSGLVSSAVAVKAKAFSGKAAEKLKAAGGEAIAS